MATMSDVMDSFETAGEQSDRNLEKLLVLLNQSKPDVQLLRLLARGIRRHYPRRPDTEEQE